MTDENLKEEGYSLCSSESFNLSICSSFDAADYSILTIGTLEKPLLLIKKDGSIIAPDLESASEAGRVFVESMRESLLKLLGENKNG